MGPAAAGCHASTPTYHASSNGSAATAAADCGAFPAAGPANTAGACATPSASTEGVVLLYYKYVPLAGREEEVKGWYQQGCSALGLRGRVRVASDGVNVTVGGTAAAVDAHIAAVKAHPLLRGADIDFKTAPWAAPASPAALAETGFSELRVAVCKELVSLGAGARSPADPFTNSGRHLAPSEFHETLLAAARGDGKPVVLVDARNAYETEIGRFDVGGVPLLDPRTRAFSELPAWLDAHEAELAGKRVLMYCTGGVRCERATAYLREKGPAFADVAQLSGGIQRYLEAFKDGGLFAGKLFVYDPRGSMEPELGAPRCVGSCAACGQPHDDYSPRARCPGCRQLILLCPACVPATHAASASGTAAPSAPQPGNTGTAGNNAPQLPLCSLCQERGGSSSSASMAGVSGMVGAVSPGRKLRILCLHGFRQDAYQFRGRCQALRKALQDMAELVFVDAPHRLPLWYRRREEAAAPSAHVQQQQQQQEVQQQEQQQDGEKDGVDVEWLLPRAPDSPTSSKAAAAAAPPPQPPKLPCAIRKRAWLVSPELLTKSKELAAADAAGGGPQWEVAPESATAASQLSLQTEGWAEALEVLTAALEAHAPIDGVLGFSQGAAVATALCAHQQWQEQQQQQQQQQQGQKAGQSVKGRIRFAILSAGFPSPCREHQELLVAAGPLRLPSLHIFGTGDAITAAATAQAGLSPGASSSSDNCSSAAEGVGASVEPQRPAVPGEALAAAFDSAAGRRLVRHGGGHDTPRTRTLLTAVLDFVSAQRAAGAIEGRDVVDRTLTTS